MIARGTFTRLTAAAALAAGAGIGRTPAFAQTLQPLRIALIPTDLAGEVYYAEDLGYFKKAGYSVTFTPITSGAAISSAVAGGSVDIGFSNVVSLAIAHERGLPFTVVAPATLHIPSQVTAGILTVLKASPIRTAKDLDGKTIAINGLNNISDASVRAWVDKNGGDSKTLKFTEVPFPQMAQAVLAGRVDAASIDAAHEQLLVKPDSDLRRLANVFDAVSPHFTPSVWFSTTGWIDAHQAAAKAFIAVIEQAAAWGNAHHAASAEILAKYLKKTPQDIQAVTRAPYATGKLGPLVQPSIDLAAKYGLIKTAFPAAEMISPLAH